jgi:hypothetical protein
MWVSAIKSNGERAARQAMQRTQTSSGKSGSKASAASGFFSKMPSTSMFSTGSTKGRSSSVAATAAPDAAQPDGAATRRQTPRQNAESR